MDKRKVLLIQPDEELTSLVKEFLGRTDFDVSATHDGLEGLEIASENRPHIVLIDLELDGAPEGGFALGKSFRNDKGLEEIPLVLIMPDDAERNAKKNETFSKTFDGFLYKPLLDTELKRVVENFTGFGETADQVIEQLDGLMDGDDTDVKGLVQDIKNREEGREKKKARSKETPVKKEELKSKPKPKAKAKSQKTGKPEGPSADELSKKINELEEELKKRDERIESLLEQLRDTEMDQSIELESLESENERLKNDRNEVIELLEEAAALLKSEKE